MAKLSKTEEIIETLNGISVGELEGIKTRLNLVKKELMDLSLADLSIDVQDAIRFLSKGEVVQFRKLLAKVVSKLGHYKNEKP